MHILDVMKRWHLREIIALYMITKMILTQNIHMKAAARAVVTHRAAIQQAAVRQAVINLAVLVTTIIIVVHMTTVMMMVTMTYIWMMTMTGIGIMRMTIMPMAWMMRWMIWKMGIGRGKKRCEAKKGWGDIYGII